MLYVNYTSIKLGKIFKVGVGHSVHIFPEVYKSFNIFFLNVRLLGQAKEVHMPSYSFLSTCAEESEQNMKSFF